MLNECSTEVSITRWKIINTSFWEFHNIPGGSKLKATQIIIRPHFEGKNTVRIVVCLLKLIFDDPMDFWKEKKTTVCQIKAIFMEKPNDISQTLKSKQTHVAVLGKVLKKTPTYVSPKLKIFVGNADVERFAEILTHPNLKISLHKT